MDTNLFAFLVSPPILFFVFGMFAGAVRSNLDIPPPIAKFFSLYLLMAIGFKGGVALSQSGFTSAMLLALLAAILMAVLVPAYSFLILRRRINPYDAAAIAATYGSVSAVTFIAASQFLELAKIEVGGYMAVALVVMESPAIIMAVLLATYVRTRETQGTAANGPDTGAPAAPLPIKAILREAFTDGTHLLLIASMVIGAITGEAGQAVMNPFTGVIFTGMLSFFLLEMGLLVARQIREAKDVSPFLIGFALMAPPVNAGAALLLSKVLGLPVGDATMVAVLAASASYIVVPAVVRYAIPEARASRYFTMALAITFPFNILLGIPLYYQAARLLLG